MDTKSRKSTKLAKLIIALVVMIPAFVLVSIYPAMERAMLEKQEYYEEQERQEKEEIGEWILEDSFIYYATEASYYLYTEMFNSVSDEKLDAGVFLAYGWDNDYARIREGTSFVATYTTEEREEPVVLSNCIKLNDELAKMVMEYDSFGNLIEIKLIKNGSLYYAPDNLRMNVEESVRQFENNLDFHFFEKDGVNVNELKESYNPKNFRIEFGLAEDSIFVGAYEDWFGGPTSYYTAVDYYMETGAYLLVVLAMVIIFFMTMTLPCIKSLNTGREKIFSMPFEVMVVLSVSLILGTIGMCYAMANTTETQILEYLGGETGFLFIGKNVSSLTTYNLLRVCNFAGWSILFFVCYVFFANLRQIFCDTKYYINYQVYSLRVLRGIKNYIVKCYKKVTNINLNDSIEKTVLKIVGLNMAAYLFLLIVYLLNQVLGMVTLLIFAVAVVIVLRQWLKQVQSQYESILNATNSMAEGDLKITLDEDLGPFQKIGDSLEMVQQGFAKAVQEEAKSQSMKTELITNVSHDLKTPLTAIITYVDLLKKEGITEEERSSYIETLDTKSQRLKVLIEDLFEVSKAHSGNVTMNFDEIDVVSLIKQVKSEMTDQIEKSNLEFRWNMPEEKVMLSLDGQKTYRVFENLLSNTLKYAMLGSRVYVDVLTNDDNVQVVFRNMSAQELNFAPELLTERFVRGDASRKSEGSGLGLAIAKSFVELQNGTLTIDIDGDLFKVIVMWKREKVS